MKTQCLFIGGPKAGRMIEVDHIALKVVLPRSEPYSTIHNDAGGFSSQGFVCDYTYFRQFLTDKSGRDHAVFVEVDCDPLIELMKFYAENKK